MLNEAGIVVEPYTYPAGPEPELPSPSWIGLAELDPATAKRSRSAVTETASDEDEHSQGQQKIDAELRERFEAGRRLGHEEGRKAEHEEQVAERLGEERRHKEQIVSLAEKFAGERDRYLHEVEHEVVELALAVAARILRRESQMDPLLLTGAVRVALGQLSKTTKVRLQVPVSELDLWTDAIEHIPNLPLKPDVLAEEGMHAGDCVISTELGSVDLGIRAQLGEIERGFFDRAGRARSGIGASPLGTNPDHTEGP